MAKHVQEETVIISKNEYEELLATDAHYEMLDAMGVDNWGGYFGRERDCNECGKYFEWHIYECPECKVELPGPNE